MIVYILWPILFIVMGICIYKFGYLRGYRKGGYNSANDVCKRILNALDQKEKEFDKASGFRY